MTKKFVLLIISTSLLFLMAQGCGESSPIECGPNDEGPVSGESATETFRVDNSNGSTDIDQDMTVSRQFQHSLDLNLNSDSSCDANAVRNQIFDTYALIDASGDKVCIVPVEVPAGKTYIYEIEWTEVIREGSIRQGAAGTGDLEGDYEIVVDLQCQVVDVKSQ